MQIHELTQPGRRLDENTLTDLGKRAYQAVTQNAGAALVQGTVGQLAQSALPAGAQTPSAGQTVTKSMRPEAAVRAATANFERMIDPTTAAWQQNLQQMMAQSNPPVTSTAQLPIQKVTEMLDGMIDTVLRVDDYQKVLDRYKSNTGTADPTEINAGRKVLSNFNTVADTANNIEQQINDGKKLILAAVANPTADSARAFRNGWDIILLGGAMPLQHLETFYSNAWRPGNAAPGQASAPQTPGQQLATAIGFNAADVARAQQAFAQVTSNSMLKKTGNQAVDEFLTLMGVKLV